MLPAADLLPAGIEFESLIAHTASSTAALSPPSHRVCRRSGQAGPAHVKGLNQDASRLKEVGVVHAAHLGVWTGREEGLLREEVKGGQPGAWGPLCKHGPPAQLLNSPSAGTSQYHGLEGTQPA